mgnify:CR=1 FL=1
MTDQETVFTWQHPGSWSGDPANILKHLNAIAATVVGNGSPVISALVMDKTHQGKGDICLSLELHKSDGAVSRPQVILCHQEGTGLFHLFGDKESVVLVQAILNQRFS